MEMALGLNSADEQHNCYDNWQCSVQFDGDTDLGWLYPSSMPGTATPPKNSNDIIGGKHSRERSQDPYSNGVRSERDVLFAYSSFLAETENQWIHQMFYKIIKFSNQL